MKPGDAVRVIDRPSTAADLRSALYYPHYAAITGTVFKIYDSGEQIAIDVDLDSLLPESRARHTEVTAQMRATLPGSSRRTDPNAPEFRLRYVILVASKDVETVRAPRRRAPA